MSELDDLERAVALAELEHAVDLALLAAGFPPGTRPPTEVEIASRCDFAALEQALDRAADRLAAIADDAYYAALDLLTDDLERTDDGPAFLARLDELDAPLTTRPLSGADDLLERTRTQLRAALVDLADETVTDTVDEAIRADLLPPGSPAPTAPADALDAQSRRLASAPLAGAVRQAREAAYRASTLDVDELLAAVVAASADGPPRSIADEVNRATNAMHGTARTTAQAALPSSARLYASELLDRNTCVECSNVDGREYSSRADALVDYPAGRFRACRGGDRCRGTLVAIGPDEAPPSPAGRPDPPGPRTPPRDDTPAVLDPTIPDRRPPPDLSPTSHATPPRSYDGLSEAEADNLRAWDDDSGGIPLALRPADELALRAAARAAARPAVPRGTAYTRAVREEYDAWQYTEFLRAEAETGGVMFTNAYRARYRRENNLAEPDPFLQFFTGGRFVEGRASEELLEYFERHPRLTFAQFRRQRARVAGDR